MERELGNYGTGEECRCTGFVDAKIVLKAGPKGCGESKGKRRGRTRWGRRRGSPRTALPISFGLRLGEDGERIPKRARVVRKKLKGETG